MSTATQRAKIATGPRLDMSKQRYRVMKGEEIIGQFSNRGLAGKTAYECHAIVLDVSVQPPKVIYKDGKWLEKSA